MKGKFRMNIALLLLFQFLLFNVISSSSADDFEDQNTDNDEFSEVTPTILNNKIDRVKQELNHFIKQTERSLGSISKVNQTCEKKIKETTTWANQKINNLTVDFMNKISKLENQIQTFESKMISTMEDTYLKTYVSLQFPSLPYNASMSCGGIVVGRKGLLRFRMNDETSDFRKCIWTVRAENYNEINLQVLLDSFTTKDFITITDINRNYYISNLLLENSSDTIGRGGITLSTASTKIGRGDRTIYNFTGPLLFITFVTTQYNPEIGFLLKYEAIENSKYNSINQDAHHINLHYSSSEMEEFKYPEKGNYPNNVLWTMVINPQIASSVGQQLSVNLKNVDIEWDINCDADSLSFYHFKTSYSNVSLAERFCGFKRSFKNKTIVGPDALIIIFATDDGENLSGFNFSWATATELEYEIRMN